MKISFMPLNNYFYPFNVYILDLVFNFVTESAESGMTQEMFCINPLRTGFRSSLESVNARNTLQLVPHVGAIRNAPWFGGGGNAQYKYGASLHGREGKDGAHVVRTATFRIIYRTTFPETFMELFPFLFSGKFTDLFFLEVCCKEYCLRPRLL